MSGYDADLFAAVHRGNEGDVRFYQDFCADSGRVLELGCGLGRVLRELQAPGRRLVGLDREPSYLERARRVAPRAECIIGDMRDFDLGESFDRIVAPFSSLYSALTEEDLIRCFARVRDHLAPGGRFAFDVWTADAFHFEGSDGDDPEDAVDDDNEPVARFELDGVDWTVYERSRCDRSLHRIDATYLHVSREAFVEATLPHRYFTSDELPGLLARGGLRLESLFGGFDTRPFDEDADSLVAIACAADV
jgi:SAM-dependent methyltransferase